MDNESTVRTATKSDRHAIEDFLAQAVAIHRHLDWRSPLDWLGNRHFLLAENNNKIAALFICTAEPNEVFWLRVFATIDFASMQKSWNQLFQYFLADLSGSHLHSDIASITYFDWMESLLKENQWKAHQYVVQLRWKDINLNKMPKKWPDDLTIRPMEKSDMEIVNLIDHECFKSIWQQSKDVINKAFDQSSHTTVAELNNEVVGFQISTSHRSVAHLARLAVSPKFQGQYIGQALVHNMIRHFRKPWIREITVNTQQDNEVSLNLYKKMGFERTGERYPVYVYENQAGDQSTSLP
jgi:ribosomal-protein-alanine N-acetyltransferase